MVFCSACGHEALDEEGLCRMCGERLIGVRELEDLQTEGQQNRRQVQSNNEQTPVEVALPPSLGETETARKAADIHRDRLDSSHRRLQHLIGDR